MGRIGLALALVAASLAPAWGSGRVLDPSGEYVLVGLDLGATWDDDFGGLFGIELSMSTLERGSWAGYFVSAAWDTALDVGRLTVGPEVGWGVVGLDLGVSIDTEARVRGRLRGVLTLALIGGYVGTTIGPEARLEFGVLLKGFWEK